MTASVAGLLEPISEQRPLEPLLLFSSKADTPDSPDRRRESNATDFWHEQIPYLGPGAIPNNQWDGDVIANHLGDSLNDTPQDVAKSQSGFIPQMPHSWGRLSPSDQAQLQSPPDSFSILAGVSPQSPLSDDSCLSPTAVPLIPTRTDVNDFQLAHDTANQPSPCAEVAENHSHMLGSLNLDLIKQLERIKDRSPHVTVHTLVSPVSQDGAPGVTPLEDALKATRQLLKIAASLSEPKHYTQRSRASISSIDSFHSFQSVSSDGSTSSSLSGSSPYIPPITSQMACPGASSEDSTALLQIITCYINVVRLHIILFIHIFRFMDSAPGSNDGRSLELTDTRFDDSQILSRHLHIAGLVKVVKSLFRSIEDLMGLPPKVGVCTHREPSVGLFSDSSLLQAAETIIQGEVLRIGDPENGDGGAEVLRRCIKSVNKLLL